MGWIVWGVVLPSCVVAAWLVVRDPFREAVEGISLERGRLRFRQQREWLEARFLTALGRVDPLERPRWEEARWHDHVHWARDYQTRKLIALVEVRLGAGPADLDPEVEATLATALFEYRKGRWIADGRRLDATGPDEALRRQARFVPVAPPDRRG